MGCWSRSADPALVVFEGGRAAGYWEKRLQQVRRAAVQDLLARAGQAQCFDPVVLVTDDAEWGQALQAEAPGLVVWRTGATPFHFGRCLKDVVASLGLERVLYMGGGAAPLASPALLARLAAAGAVPEGAAPGRLVANNLYSADIVGFAPALAALESIDLPAEDNILAWRLHQQAGLPVAPAPDSLALHLDIDTPAELAVLALAPQTGPCTRAALARWSELPLARYRQLMAAFQDEWAEVSIWGRVGSKTWGFLDRHTRCRLRVFSEERGMKALGRDASGQAVSFLGYLMDEIGPSAFFRRFGQASQALAVDTRVLFAHRRLVLPAEERFLSDLGLWQEIRTPWLRDFTRAATEAPLPVLLGGHSLVAGGLPVLAAVAEGGEFVV